MDAAAPSAEIEATGTSTTPQLASQTINSTFAAAAMQVARRGMLAALGCAIFTLGLIWLAGATSDGMAAMCTIFVASLISSTAGFAFSGLCGAALFHLVPSPARAVEIMLVCSVANQAMMTWSMRKQIVWRTVARYAFGGIMGVLAGIVIVRTMLSSTYVVFAVFFLICYGAYTLFVRAPRLPDLPAFDAAVRTRIVWCGDRKGIKAFVGHALSTLYRLEEFGWLASRWEEAIRLRLGVPDAAIIGPQQGALI
jgi:hypothetical protein